jgi:hypothetical protein
MIESKWISLGGDPTVIDAAKENREGAIAKKARLLESPSDSSRENFGTYHLPAELILSILR